MIAREGRDHCLLAEDEALVAIHVEDLLSGIGLDVTIASNLQDALARADAGDFDCAILDVNLRGSQSFPVADRLRARGIPFAFITGYGAEGVEARFDDIRVLQKPFTEADLRGLLAWMRGE